MKYGSKKMQHVLQQGTPREEAVREALQEMNFHLVRLPVDAGRRMYENVREAMREVLEPVVEENIQGDSGEDYKLLLEDLRAFRHTVDPSRRMDIAGADALKLSEEVKTCSDYLRCRGAIVEALDRSVIGREAVENILARKLERILYPDILLDVIAENEGLEFLLLLWRALDCLPYAISGLTLYFLRYEDGSFRIELDDKTVAALEPELTVSEVRCFETMVHYQFKHAGQGEEKPLETCDFTITQAVTALLAAPRGVAVTKAMTRIHDELQQSMDMSCRLRQLVFDEAYHLLLGDAYAMGAQNISPRKLDLACLAARKLGDTRPTVQLERLENCEMFQTKWLNVTTEEEALAYVQEVMDWCLDEGRSLAVAEETAKLWILWAMAEELSRIPAEYLPRKEATLRCARLARYIWDGEEFSRPLWEVCVRGGELFFPQWDEATPDEYLEAFHEMNRVAGFERACSRVAAVMETWDTFAVAEAASDWLEHQVERGEEEPKRRGRPVAAQSAQTI